MTKTEHGENFGHGERKGRKRVRKKVKKGN